MGYDDPRLAAICGIDNPVGPDHDFFRRMAGEHRVTDIIDLRCGIGVLTVTMTSPSRSVTGIDPTVAMLDHARVHSGSDAATWVLGTGEQIAPESADMVVMSGNVAMHTTSGHIARGPRPGGILVFGSRNPEARACEQWNDELAERDTSVGRLREIPDPRSAREGRRGGDALSQRVRRRQDSHRCRPATAVSQP